MVAPGEAQSPTKRELRPTTLRCCDHSHIAHEVCRSRVSRLPTTLRQGSRKTPPLNPPIWGLFLSRPNYRTGPSLLSFYTRQHRFKRIWTSSCAVLLSLFRLFASIPRAGLSMKNGQLCRGGARENSGEKLQAEQIRHTLPSGNMSQTVGL